MPEERVELSRGCPRGILSRRERLGHRGSRRVTRCHRRTKAAASACRGLRFFVVSPDGRRDNLRDSHFDGGVGVLRFPVPKKLKHTEAEIHAMIVQDVKIRLGCADFAPDFTLHAVHDPRANWDVREARNADTWAPDCAQAFKEAVARARRKFDITWVS